MKREGAVGISEHVLACVHPPGIARAGVFVLRYERASPPPHPGRLRGPPSTPCSPHPASIGGRPAQKPVFCRRLRPAAEMPAQ